MNMPISLIFISSLTLAHAKRLRALGMGTRLPPSPHVRGGHFHEYGPYTAKKLSIYRKRSQALQTVYDTVYESETIRRGYDICRSRTRPPDTIWFSSTCTVRYRSKSLQEKSGKINRALEMMSHCSRGYRI